MNYSPIWKRFVAFLVDSTLVFVVYILVAGLALLPIIPMIAMYPDQPDPPLIFIVYMIFYCLLIITVVFALMFYFYIWHSYKHQGQTIGKRMMSIRAVKEDGSDLTLGQTSLRFLLLYFIRSITWITALFDDRKKMVHDMACSTVVIDIG
jgi:uncharacterized RDD family membrane protein YckC